MVRLEREPRRAKVPLNSAGAANVYSRGAMGDTSTRGSNTRRYRSAATALILSAMGACTRWPSQPDAIPAAGGAGAGVGHLSPPGLPEGATEGPISLNGRVVSAAGEAVVGVRIDLSGAESAVRYSGLDGRFKFQVAPGRFRLSATGDCPISPSSNDVAVSQEDVRRDFEATAEDGCVTAMADPEMYGARFALKEGAQGIASLGASIHKVHGGPVLEMQTMASRLPGGHYLTISGRPALERQALVSFDGGELYGPGQAFHLSTAIVFDDRLLCIESVATDDTDARTLAWLAAVGRAATIDAIPRLPIPPPERTVRVLPLPTR